VQRCPRVHAGVERLRALAHGCNARGRIWIGKLIRSESAAVRESNSMWLSSHGVARGERHAGCRARQHAKQASKGVARMPWNPTQASY